MPTRFRGRRDKGFRTVRFDDSLDTVLAAEMSSPAATEWTWRQLVDLIGRRRAGARAEAIQRLYAIRGDVPPAARAASARGLERADPPAVLVALFAADDVAVAAPVVRSARLTAAEWLPLLADMRPATRGVLRLRRDLPDDVRVGLEAFGPTDYALGGVAAPAPPATTSKSGQFDGARAVTPASDTLVPDQPASPAPPPPATFVPPARSPFTAVADIARELPVVAEALRREGAAPTSRAPVAADFEIAALVARIEARRATPPLAPPVRDPAAAPTTFRYETDAAGLIRWVEGVERGAVVGLSLNGGRDGGAVNVDGVAAGAIARRAGFGDARLDVPGTSEAGGSWRISGLPVFDPASGRFTGYRGTARRPRPDEAPETMVGVGATDALRQLVHELRTPANAISGFAEMIERELLGPVPAAYREQAEAIRSQTGALLEAIDDLDTAARLESRRLDLHTEGVALSPVLARVLEGLHPLATLRGVLLRLEVTPDTMIRGDARAVERLVARFLAFVVAGATDGRTVRGLAGREGDMVQLVVDRPGGLVVPGAGLFDSDDEIADTGGGMGGDGGGGGPLLGVDFGFRLARRLARELGGGLAVEPERLTLRLPAAVEAGAEQARL